MRATVQTLRFFICYIYIHVRLSTRILLKNFTGKFEDGEIRTANNEREFYSFDSNDLGLQIKQHKNLSYITNKEQSRITLESQVGHW